MLFRLISKNQKLSKNRYLIKIYKKTNLLKKKIKIVSLLMMEAQYF